MFSQAMFDHMIRSGSDFEQKIAIAWRVADEKQSQALIRAFPDIFTSAKYAVEQARAVQMVKKAVAS